MSIFGIDFGSTCCRIAKLDMQGVPEIIHNNEDFSDDLSSALYFESSEIIIYGSSALEYIEIDGTNVIQDIRSGIIDESKHYLIHGKEYTSLELLSFILKKLKDMAEEQGEQVHNVVIGTPAYFDSLKKAMFVKAGDMVGLNVIDVIAEPIAALKGYYYRQVPDNRNVLVFDLGGKNLDVSLLNISNKEDEEVNIIINDNYNIGGKDWDEVLFGFMKTKVMEEFSLSEDDLNADILQTIRLKVEPSKKKLSILDETRVKIRFEGQMINIEFTRDEFENLTKSLVNQMMCYIDETIEKAKQLLNDDFHIDEVLLVGGATNMPMIENTIKEKFANVIIPDDYAKTVVYGAAVHGNQLSKKVNPSIKSIDLLYDFCGFAHQKKFIKQKVEPEMVKNEINYYNQETYAIDFGATCCRIGKIDDHKNPIIIQNTDYKNYLECVIYFKDIDNMIIGESAKEYVMEEKEFVIQNIKKEIGNEYPPYVIYGNSFTAVELSSLILKKLKQMAEMQGDIVKDVIISVPSYFKDKERNFIKEACELAKLNLKDVVNDSTAIAYNYFHSAPDNEMNFLIYDLGGETFDVSLIKMIRNHENIEYHIIATTSNDMLGGKEWDDVLFEFMKTRVMEKFGLFEDDLDEYDMQIIFNEVEKTKIYLTTHEKADVIINFEGQPIMFKVTKKVFEDLTKSLVNQTMNKIEHVLYDAKNNFDSEFHIDKVLLAGGASKMPMIIKAAEEKFPDLVYHENSENMVINGMLKMVK